VSPVLRSFAAVAALSLAVAIAVPVRADEPASGTHPATPTGEAAPVHAVAPAPGPPMPPAAPVVAGPDAGGALKQPPIAPDPTATVYSRETGEKIAFTGLDYADHFISMFGIGVGTGAIFAATASSDGTTYAIGMAVGGIAYTMPSLGLILANKLDRGDLPLIALLSSAPVYALLAPASRLRLDTDDRNNQGASYGDFIYSRRVNSAVYWAIPAVAGGLGFVTAHLLAAHLRFDPGDMQWLRDATFWGAAIGAGGAAIAVSMSYNVDATTALAVAVPSGMGLGLLAGFLGAHYGDFSYERTYYATLAGYGGALVGAGISAVSGSGAVVAGTAMGFAALSFGLTFGLSSFLDKIPDDAVIIEDSAGPVAFFKRTNWLQPAMLPYVNELGQQQSGFGLKIAEGRW
jgi:hypothetical protein